jgi:hypothetical protein
MAGGKSNGQHDAVRYSKIEFNALVEEKILEEHNGSSNDNNNSGNGTMLAVVHFFNQMEIVVSCSRD